LFALRLLAGTIIAPDTPWRLRSLLPQAGIVAWVAFWALYGQGFTAANATAITSFGAAYMLVIIVEPLADLAVLAAAKAFHRLRGSLLVGQKLFDPA
jgi:hypothetical protein